MQQNVDPMATLSADEASHWDLLHAGWTVERVNLSEVCSVSPHDLHQYANQAAWLEGNRRTSNGGLAHGLVANAMEGPASRAWKGYWQREV